uniref:Uncharacterized protein n=1 Tax=Ditylenchus dipsaci TaxID=166011 RepID=A0A915E6E1_9BILA
MENKPYFLGALESLSFLQALNLDSWDRCIDSEVLLQIAQKNSANRLERIASNAYADLSGNCLWKQKEKIKIPLEFHNHFRKFLEDLCAKGKLKYFCTNTQVAMKTICNALVKCKNLTQLAWGYNRLQYKMLFETLDQIHGKQLPTCSKDPRILKVKTPKVNKDAPTHAWVVFSDYLNNDLLEDYY